MKQDFDNATQTIEIISANKKLTQDNYSHEKAIELAKNVWNTIQAYVKKNIYVYQKWNKQNYEQRKEFVSDILNMLVEKFDGANKNKPKIYFKETIQPVWPKQIRQPAACCYSPALSPWAEKYFAATTLDVAQPFFAFFDDLSIDGMLGRITHEFTHYLQSIGRSSVPYNIVKQAAEYYQYYYMDKTKYKQIYIDSVHEVEARDIGMYVHEQAIQMIKINNEILARNNEK